MDQQNQNWVWITFIVGIICDWTLFLYNTKMSSCEKETHEFHPPKISTT